MIQGQRTVQQQTLHLDGFIVPDDASITEGSESESDDVFYLKTTNLLNQQRGSSSGSYDEHFNSYEGISLDSSSTNECSVYIPSGLSFDGSASVSDNDDGGSDSGDSESESKSANIRQATNSATNSNLSKSFTQQFISDEEEEEDDELFAVPSLPPSKGIQASLSTCSDDSFEELLKEGLRNKAVKSGKPGGNLTPIHGEMPRNSTPVQGKPSGNATPTLGKTPGKLLRLTTPHKLRTLMESNKENLDTSLPDVSDDDVILVSEYINTPAPTRKPKLQPLYGRPGTKAISEGSYTPVASRPPMMDRKLSRTEPRAQNAVAAPAAFLASLSTNLDKSLTRHAEAIKFVKDFKKHKQLLAERLSDLYNRTVFDSKLSEVKVTFNKRLLKTAGLCKYMTTRTSKLKQASIELSEKVCDSAERVRDTLIHELCHAAVWIINETQDGHGRYWQYWARKSELSHKSLPPIRRCHSYDITTKYVYKCGKCGQQVGRHSKSLDIQKKVCGICKGRFELLTRTNSKSLTKTPAKGTPNKFAMFVKENYASVKKDRQLSHKEVMQELSKGFAGKLML